jgi:hypothetical protein
MKNGAWRVPQIWKVGQDLDPNVTAESVHATHKRDHKSLATQNWHPPL